MMWHLLCIVLWATSVCASLLPFNDESYPQVPLGDPLANPSCVRETKVVPADEALPTIDLGYTKHKAVKNINPNLYKFQSIRYAAPPTGDLRFRAPRPPLKAPDDETVEDGSGRKQCLQATVKWAETFPENSCASSKICECCKDERDTDYCEEPCGESKPLWGSTKRLLGGLIPNPSLTDPNYYSEDCLFLDVWTPKHAIDEIDKDYPLPVLVWIYGGAYVFGGKSLYFPGGLMDRAMKQGSGGMIFVAMNYRMGALGFAAGKDINDEDINAGLLDQQQALQWVQEHIAKFGGDPDRVTIAGLSAGGGSVLHHITAYGRKETNLFQRAISLSGGWQPITNKETAESTFRDFMEINSVSTLDELRQVPEEQMIQANFDHIISAPPGSFLYNPTAWGNFTPESPSKLYSKGKFAEYVEIIVSNVQDEGGQFTAAFKEHKTTVAEFVDLALPDVTQEEKQWILETYDSGKDDPADIGRIIGDVTFRCHATYVSDAKYKELWRQKWNTVESNGHGGDLLYLFYQPLVPVQSIRSARILQDYVVMLATEGYPDTIVRNPYPFPNPVGYLQHFYDNKVQVFDTGVLHFPNVRRRPTESDGLCRKWQKMSST